MNLAFSELDRDDNKPNWDGNHTRCTDLHSRTGTGKQADDNVAERIAGWETIANDWRPPHIRVAAPSHTAEEVKPKLSLPGEEKSRSVVRFQNGFFSHSAFASGC